MPEQQIPSLENMPNPEQDKNLVDNLKENMTRFVDNREKILKKSMGEDDYLKYFKLLEKYRMEEDEERISKDFKKLERKYIEALDEYDSEIGTRISINKVPEKTPRKYSYDYYILDSTGDTLESMMNKEIYFDENGKIRAFSTALDQEKPTEPRSKELIEDIREMEREEGTNDQEFSNQDITTTNNILNFLNSLQETYLKTL